MKPDEIRDLVRERIKELGLTYKELSGAARMNPTYIQQYLKKHTPLVLPEKVREAIAPLLGLRPSDLKPSTDLGSSTTAPSQEVRVAEEVSLPAFGDLPKDVPVYGTVVGGTGVGEFEVNGEIVDLVRRPPGISATKGAFALYVENDSMWPWRASGSLVYIHPDRKARVGDHVVVELKDNDGEHRSAVLKKLVSLGGLSVQLAQYNPPRDDLYIPTTSVRRIWRVMDWEELLGI